MAESTLSHLNYGHAGAATYDIDSRSWNFGREISTTTLRQIGISNRASIETVPGSMQFPSTAVSTRITDAYDGARSLARRHAHLVPAVDLLPSLAATSAGVISIASTFDPLVGSLYSTGSVACQTQTDRSEKPRHVAALVAGEGRNILRLTFLQKENMGWGADKNVRMRGETLRDAESGYWNEEAAPIQQLCFAQSEERSALLAVRLPAKTVLFRPFYTQCVKAAPHSPYYSLPPSTIDAHPILHLDIEQTGGSPHVDVTFNPDYQLQFAVVDQNRVWSVWDIGHARKGDLYSLSCLVQGPIAPPEEADQIADDGWARILWVGDVNTILVCNRRQLSIIDIKGGSFTYLPWPKQLAWRSEEWILDVRSHPLLRSHFFILTSSNLFLISVTTLAEAAGMATGAAGAHVLLSWRHYRGAEDFTLSLSVGTLDEVGMQFSFSCH
jgi:RNA polymerase I-specific transcription initiation factor RRN6